jgi:glycine dehydrogenase subunit 1
MARRVLPERNRIWISRGLHPEYRAVVRTYVSGLGGVEVVEVPFAADGRLDRVELERSLDERAVCVVVGYPNFFGVVEDLAAAASAAHGVGALCLSVTAEPVALGLLRAPGDLGCDIAVAEGQSLGLPLSYGGPGVGLFASRERFLRNMPGRLVGQTVDVDGRRGFVLTLATREQHIRRERATSNICTNQGLCALAVTVFLCLAGKRGLRALAERNYRNAHYALSRLEEAGARARFSAPFFNEFVIEVASADDVCRRLRHHDLVPGLRLDRWFPELRECLLLCVTEVHERRAIDRLASALAKAARAA